MKEKDEKSLVQRLKEIAGSAIEPGASAISDIFIDGVLGAVIPGYTSFRVNYKQARAERNFIRFFTELCERVDIIETNFSKMSEDNRKMIKEHFAGLLCDYVMDEQQEEKIGYFANGFVTLTSKENLDFDETILYLDILKSLRLIDLKILFDSDRRYSKILYYDQMLQEYLEKLGLDWDHYKMIREKLFRNGLFKSSYDDEYRKVLKNVNTLIEFAVSLQNGKPKKLPSNFKSFLPKDRESISMSDLGRKFVDFFIDYNDKQPK
jgi:hypothetical protein